MGYCEGVNYENCTITLQDASNTDNMIDYHLNVTYDEPTSNSEEINKYFSKLKDADLEYNKTWYKLSDLFLINYYLKSSHSEL